MVERITEAEGTGHVEMDITQGQKIEFHGEPRKLTIHQSHQSLSGGSHPLVRAEGMRGGNKVGLINVPGDHGDPDVRCTIILCNATIKSKKSAN